MHDDLEYMSLNALYTRLNTLIYASPKKNAEEIEKIGNLIRLNGGYHYPSRLEFRFEDVLHERFKNS